MRMRFGCEWPGCEQWIDVAPEEGQYVSVSGALWTADDLPAEVRTEQFVAMGAGVYFDCSFTFPRGWNWSDADVRSTDYFERRPKLLCPLHSHRQTGP